MRADRHAAGIQPPPKQRAAESLTNALRSSEHKDEELYVWALMSCMMRVSPPDASPDWVELDATQVVCAERQPQEWGGTIPKKNINCAYRVYVTDGELAELTFSEAGNCPMGTQERINKQMADCTFVYPQTGDMVSGTFTGQYQHRIPIRHRYGL